MAYSIFISYKNSVSKSEAEKLQERLNEYGYHVFRDKGLDINGDYGIENGQKWIAELNKAIKKAQIIIIFITEESLKGFHNVFWKNGYIFENINGKNKKKRGAALYYRAVRSSGNAGAVCDTGRRCSGYVS